MADSTIMHSQASKMKLPGISKMVHYQKTGQGTYMMSTKYDHDPLRPSLLGQYAILLGLCLICVFALFNGWGQHHGVISCLIWTMVLAVLPFSLLGAFFLFVQRFTIELAPDAVRFQNAFGTQSLAYSDIDSIEETAMLGAMNKGKQLLVITKKDKRFIRLNSSCFPEKQDFDSVKSHLQSKCRERK